MAFADRFRRPAQLTEATAVVTDTAALDGYAERLRQEQDTNLLLHESMADLTLALEDQGWQRISLDADRELSKSGIQKISTLCRAMAAVNPLIGRGLRIRSSYVFGQGVEIAAREASSTSAQDVNAVIQAFVDDPRTQSTLLSAQAREERERANGTDGNQFIALDTVLLTGRVRPRIIPPDQIADLISDPDDAQETWYVLRDWSAPRMNLDTGAVETNRWRVYHPVVGYSPAAGLRRDTIAGVPVRWDQPVLHIAVNRIGENRWGIPDAYAAIGWARGYKGFLEDWATLVKALSRFAWRATAPGSKAPKTRAAIAAAPTRDPITGQAHDVGATALMSQGSNLEAIPKSGATIDSGSGKPLAAMVGTALDVPVTMLLGDPGTTGARAVAETLDRPTRLAFEQRQSLWAGWLSAIIDHVIDASVRAPRGALRGTVVVDDGMERVELSGDTSRTVEIVWPSLEDVDAASRVRAIVEAESTQLMPPLVVVRLLLAALDVVDVDEVVNELTDDSGAFIDPRVGAAAEAVAAWRRGEDPAALLS